jgi:hypothetical protein
MRSSRSPRTLTPLVWTVCVLAAGVLLHIDQFPLWVAGVMFGLIAWRLSASTRPASLPGKLVRALVALGLVVAVFVQFHSLSGLIPGTALLTLMTGIKLLETHNRRDQYIVVGGCLFLLLAACLERQGLTRAPLYLLDVWLCCSALACIGYSPGKGEPAIAAPPATSSDSALPQFDSATAIKLAGRSLLYSVPLAVLLFVFFPRLPGAFWSLPRNSDAETGLSDSMSPGSISQLTASYDIAFRAKFDGDLPPPQDRYWRGPVLHDFDGYTWKRRLGGTYRAQPLEYLGKAYHYRITLEPSQQNWWLALDTVDQSPSSHTIFTYDYELVDRDPVTESTSYNASSHTETRSTEPLSKLGRQTETQWPQGRNPRTLEFAHQLRAKVASDGAYIDAVLQYFRSNGFVYSLTPPLCLRVRVTDARRRHSSPGRDRLPGRRVESSGRVPGDPSIGCSFLGGGLARGAWLDPGRSHCGGGAGPAHPRYVGSTAGCGLGRKPFSARLAGAPRADAALGCHQYLVDRPRVEV